MTEDKDRTIPWGRLRKEFASFRAPHDSLRADACVFVDSLLSPPPPFVQEFVALRIEQRETFENAVKDLYFFLLEKRYQERLNLLHFAFSIFDEGTHLPQDIIDMTPFPHEDGIPEFKYFSRCTPLLSSL